MRNFLSLAASVIAIAVVLTVTIALLAQWLAPRVPFEVETALADRYAGSTSSGGEVERYLQGLTDRLAAAEQLPPGMTIRAHYENKPVVNAFATIGGHIVMFRGMLAKVPDENTLAMVMAHEIGHVLHRHPVAALGRGLAVSVVLSAISGGAGNNLAGRVMGQSGLLTMLTFNRAQEEEADTTALATLVKVYGHAGGSTDLFDVLRQAAQQPEPPKFLSTHPLSGDRTQRLTALAHANGWPLDGIRTPLPAEIQALIVKSGSAPTDDKNDKAD